MLEIALLLSGWLLGFVFFLRPKFPGRPSDFNSRPSLSIIIPARNEAHNLQKLLSSIVSQSCKPLEILVMNDHSTDNTAEVARQNGATVLDVPELPAGWNGKPFACYSGAKQARGDFLLFLDADLWIEKGGIEKIIALTRQENAVWSICPFHEIKRGYEEFSSVFNLMMLCGTGAFAAGFSGKARLTGQAMLISKQDYWKSGGHEAVKGKVLENFFLTDDLLKLGLTTHTLGGKGALSMRMFPVGFVELIQSWKKGFVTGATKTPPLLMALIVMWMSAGISTFILLARSVAQMEQGWPLVSISMYLLFVAQIRWMLTKIGTFGWVNALAFPVFFIFFISLFFYSTLTKLLGQKTAWKGRHVG